MIFFRGIRKSLKHSGQKVLRRSIWPRANVLTEAVENIQIVGTRSPGAVGGSSSGLSLANPVDNDGKPPLTEALCSNFAEPEQVDAVIVHLPIDESSGGLKFAQDIADVAKTTAKPIVVAAYDTIMINVRKMPRMR